MRTVTVSESEVEAVNCPNCGCGNIFDEAAEDCEDCANWRVIFWTHFKG